jgi:hypothetical protein
MSACFIGVASTLTTTVLSIAVFWGVHWSKGMVLVSASVNGAGSWSEVSVPLWADSSAVTCMFCFSHHHIRLLCRGDFFVELGGTYPLELVSQGLCVNGKTRWAFKPRCLRFSLSVLYRAGDYHNVERAGLVYCRSWWRTIQSLQWRFCSNLWIPIRLPSKLHLISGCHLQIAPALPVAQLFHSSYSA